MRWYVSVGGASRGPLDEAEIVAKLQSGELAGATHIAAEGSQDWKPVESHPPFAAARGGGGHSPAPVALTPAPSSGTPKVASTMAMDASQFAAAAEAASQAGLTPSPVAGMSPQPISGEPLSGQPMSGAGQFGSHPGSQPGFAQSAPAATPPAGGKSKVLKIVGCGCLGLLLLSCCLFGGLVYWAANRDPFAIRTVEGRMGES